jgi:hypothetical protein
MKFLFITMFLTLSTASFASQKSVCDEGLKACLKKAVVTSDSIPASIDLESDEAPKKEFNAEVAICKLAHKICTK